VSLQNLHAAPRVTTTDQAYNAVLGAILDGSILPGAALPLQSLARSLGMSIMPVREAIRQLEAIGLIEIEPHRGARVRPVSEEDLEDTYRARIELEGTLVEMAARRLTNRDAENAQLELDAQQLALRGGDLAAARQAHENFHFAIYRAAGSDWLCRSVIPAWRNSERYRAPDLGDPVTQDLRRAEHEEILLACIGRDPGRARTALRKHLMSTFERLNPLLAARLNAHRTTKTYGAITPS
jgi:DNA-binding GntR family transcriptional regulator